MITQNLEEQTVQCGPEERRIAWGDQHEVSASHMEAFVETFDRTAIMTYVEREASVGQGRSDPGLSSRASHGHDRLPGEGRHRLRDVGDERATCDLDEGLGASESTGLATREDERRVHGDRMVALLEKAGEGEISRRGFRRMWRRGVTDAHRAGKRDPVRTRLHEAA